MKEIIIKIFEASDEGYMYDIYDTESIDDDTESVDGGQCTSDDIAVAIKMASDQAIEYVKNNTQCNCACHFIDTTGCDCECNKSYE